MTSNAAEPKDVLFRIKRGLAGYVSYLAACEMNEAFSEYVLYEPILRILTARNFTVKCEYPCYLLSGNGGDHKRVDFYAQKNDLKFALEVKWAKHREINIERDHPKLACFRNKYPNTRAFLCVFGRLSHIENLVLRMGDANGEYRERGKLAVADLRKTKFGCRIFELDRTDNQNESE